jgi:membrane protease YdiL (CAAX protease family)
VFQTCGAGLGLGALAVWRKSIWPSIVAHAGVDALGIFALHVLMPLAHKYLQAAPK